MARRRRVQHRRGRAVRHRGRALRRSVQVQDAGGVCSRSSSDRRGKPVGEGLARTVRGERAHDLRRARPGRRVLGEAGAYQAREQRRCAAEIGLLVDDLVEHRGRGEVTEGTAAGRCEGEHRAEREDVAGRADVPAQRLLGRHIAGRADHQSRLRHAVPVDRPRDAEVDDPGAVGRHQDVRRLQVTVDETGRVDLLERGREPGAERAHRRLGQRAVRGDDIGEVGAQDVRRREPGQRCVGRGVDHGGGVAAGNGLGDVDLVPEPLPERLVRGEVLAYDLHRDGTAAGRPREIHPAHAACAKSREQPVRSQLPRIIRLQGVHGRPHPFVCCALWSAVSCRQPTVGACVAVGTRGVDVSGPDGAASPPGSRFPRPAP